ncbi:MAG: 30S ribosomal protein S9 [Leptospirales bacterium]|nr:30S ribosomal protein S9 [Leptospirales bacterium]
MAKDIFTVGRRKNAIARVKLSPGKGELLINGRKPEEYFRVGRMLSQATEGLRLTGSGEKYDLHVYVQGGGISGQAGAVRMGIARALQLHDQSLRAPLKKAGMLMRDSRMVERKKYGLHKARRGTQFSKR